MHLCKTMFAAALIIQSVCAAQTGEKFTKKQAVAFALENNAELRAVKIGIEAAKAKLSQSGRLETPVFEIEYGNDMPFNDDGEYELGVKLAQKFPLTGRLSKEREISKIDVEMARTEYLEARRLTALRAELAYISAQEKIAIRRIREESLGILERIVENAEKAASAGEAHTLEADIAKSEAARLKIELAQAKIDAATALIALENELGLGDSKTLEITDELKAEKVPDARFGADVLERRPDYRMFKLAADSARAGVALAKAGKLEDVEVGVFFNHGRESESDAMENKGILGLSVAIALPFNSYDGTIGEKLALRRQAEARAAGKETSVRNEIRTWLMRAREYEKALDEHVKTAETLSLTAYENFMRARNAGQADIQQILKVRQNVLETKLARLNLLARQAESVANLNAAMAINAKLN